MGLLDQIVELSRQQLANDSKFLKKMLYYFELVVPNSVAPQGRYIYPLVLNPQSLSFSEPFAVETAFTNGAGLFVEEQGIIARELTISGTTGWAPRKQKRGPSGMTQLNAPANGKTYARSIVQQSQLIHALSGQRHFQFLQDTVFRTYSDLKRDPQTSEGTALYFHSTKDDEHWRVIPQRFDLDRTASKPLEYPYRIQMIALPIDKFDYTRLAEDAPVIQTLRDPFAAMRYAINGMQAALQDLGAVQGQLVALNGNFASLFSGTTQLLDSTTALVNGTADIIESPFKLVNATIDSGLVALAEMNAAFSLLEDTFREGIPASLLNTLRKMIDAVAVLGVYPEHFVTNIQQAVQKFQDRLSLATSQSSEALSEAGSRRPPGTLRDFNNQGTRLMPGDALRAQNTFGLGTAMPNYTSAVEHVVGDGETMATIAAQFLGDARQWKYVALFNDLQPPFISAEGLPGTVRVGAKILIPTFGIPPTAQANPAVLGARDSDSADAHTLGRDLALVQVTRDQFDLQIDVSGGATDFQRVEGIPNLKQAIRTRLITEQGTDTLYKALGCARIVGLGVTTIDLETARGRLAECVLADPRIASIRDLVLTVPQPDAVEVDLTAEVKGFTRPERITVSAPAA